MAGVLSNQDEMEWVAIWRILDAASNGDMVEHADEGISGFEPIEEPGNKAERRHGLYALRNLALLRVWNAEAERAANRLIWSVIGCQVDIWMRLPRSRWWIYGDVISKTAAWR